MQTPYVQACLDTGWVGGFDENGDPVFESRPALQHFSVTPSYWLIMVTLAAAKAGIQKVEFTRGGTVVQTKTLDELKDMVLAHLKEMGNG